MPLRIIIRPEVPDDIDEIISYFERHGGMSPFEFGEVFFSTLDDLALMPGLGVQSNFAAVGFTEFVRGRCGACAKFSFSIVRQVTASKSLPSYTARAI